MTSNNLVENLTFKSHFLYMRLAVAAIVGIVVAGLLTLFMHVLIEFSQQELVESSRANILDFVRVKREESSQRKKPKPQRPKTQETPPAPPTPQTNNQSMNDSGLQVSLPSANTDVNVDMSGVIGTGDGEYLPIVKVAPAYPIKAAVDGTEGDCIVEFTVTTTGATKDVVSVPELCIKVFAKPSIAAARKFKYKPRIVNGEAIEVPHVRNRFEYRLQNREDVQ